MESNPSGTKRIILLAGASGSHRAYGVGESGEKCIINNHRYGPNAKLSDCQIALETDGCQCLAMMEITRVRSAQSDGKRA